MIVTSLHDPQGINVTNKVGQSGQSISAECEFYL